MKYKEEDPKIINMREALSKNKMRITFLEKQNRDIK